MSNRDLLGRVLISVATATAAFLPLFIDLGPSHVTNEAWPAHARLHGVWLLGTCAMVGLMAMYFVWFYRANRALAVTLGSLLTATVLLGFFLAAATAPLYGGSLGGPDADHGGAMMVPPNLLIFVAAFVLLVIGTLLARGAVRDGIDV